MEIQGRPALLRPLLVVVTGITAVFAGPAHAQDGAAEGKSADMLDEVVVTGLRASMQSAQDIKRQSGQIVDAIVAEDIGKLPDNNVAEALQRISGIQIDRVHGEGSSIAIRGLTQVRTEINGRDVFTANEGRALSFEDVPAELLAGVEVYKNPAADVIEGGLGGTVNLRTRKPFDFNGLEVTGSLRANYYDLVDETTPSYSGLISNRWETGIGEIGALVNVAYQEGNFRTDTVSVEPFWEMSNVPGFEGQTVTVPRGGGVASVFGDRKRVGTAAALQWRPNEQAEIYFQTLRSDYKFKWRDFSYFAYTGGSDIVPAAGYPFAFTPDGEFLSGTFADVPVDSNTSIATRNSITTDYSLGGSWRPTDKLTLASDVQYIEATTDSLRYIISMNTRAPLFHHDISGDLPSMSVEPGNQLTLAENYQWGWHLDHLDDNEGDEKAWRMDADYALSDSFGFKAGARYTDRGAENKSSQWRWMGLFQPSSTYDAWTMNPFTDFFRGEGQLLGRTIAASEALVADYENTRNMFGQTEPLTFNPDNINAQGEETTGAYGLFRFELDKGRFPIDGNIGLRLVKTNVQSSGVMTDPLGSGELLPVDVRNSYTSTLPSVNVRTHLSDELQWRVAMSKGLSRAPFDKLNPNLSLSETLNGDGQVTSRTGTAGNPNLRPLEADQMDTSLEWYYARSGMVYGALFYKKVDGFIANVVQEEVYGGAAWEVTRPLNGDNGKIRGVELGFEGFADFLPAPFDGFGVQANYTYVDSEAPSPAASDTSGRALLVPLEGLSKNSYNLIGIYEKGPLAIRAAYNWRSDWVRTTAGNGTGNLPIFDDGFGQLDASISYDIMEGVTVILDGVNLTDTERSTIFGRDTRPRDYVLTDRRLGLGVRVDL